MAIDSAAKRSSIAGIHWAIVPGITPDPNQGLAWRLSSGYSYAGISFVVAITVPFVLLDRNIDFTLSKRDISITLLGRTITITLPKRKT